MRTSRTLSLSLLVAFQASAGASWEKSMEVSVGANQNDTRIYVDGTMYEKRTVGLELQFDGSLNGSLAPGTWNNSLKIDYAGSKTKDETNTYNVPKWTESSDQLTLDSLFRFKAAFFMKPYASLNVQTAVYDCNSPEEWAAFRPLQLRESSGLDLPIPAGQGRELHFRAGYFYQHYLNRGKADRDPTHGFETILEFNGALGKRVSFKSKAGLYTGLAATDDLSGQENESRKAVLEWDNKLEVALSKTLSLDITYNVDNKDVSSEDIAYEIDHRTSLAFNWKVF